MTVQDLIDALLEVKDKNRTFTVCMSNGAEGELVDVLAEPQKGMEDEVFLMAQLNT